MTGTKQASLHGKRAFVSSLEGPAGQHSEPMTQRVEPLRSVDRVDRIGQSHAAVLALHSTEAAGEPTGYSVRGDRLGKPLRGRATQPVRDGVLGAVTWLP